MCLTYSKRQMKNFVFILRTISKIYLAIDFTLLSDYLVILIHDDSFHTHFKSRSF